MASGGPGETSDEPRLEDLHASPPAAYEPTAEQRAAKARRDALFEEQIAGARAAAKGRKSEVRRGQAKRYLIRVVVVVVVGALLWRLVGHSSPSTATFGTRSGEGGAVLIDDRLVDRPKAGIGAKGRPLGAPPVVAASDDYAFEQLQPDRTSPVTWDPCRPIHLVVNSARAPRDGDALLRGAVTALHQATGLELVIDGPTDERPTEQRKPVVSDRHGRRWAPVLVAWTDPSTVPALAGAVAGQAGGLAVPTSAGAKSKLAYVTGVVDLDGPDIALVEEEEGEGPAASIIKHELAHLVGLAHVNDPTQIMNPVGSATVIDYAAGDRAGLALLNPGRCIKGV